MSTVTKQMRFKAKPDPDFYPSFHPDYYEDLAAYERQEKARQSGKVCPVCGYPMSLDEVKKGGVYKRKRMVYECIAKDCRHRESIENETIEP